ncbi:unnamed protein product [Leptidea sinapis]|uniref:Odorant receptor n=1 Tax=Leptidea sinapis TaxID=189913 RepID=A0A5E4PSY8_9NEOP|nr:unnamed protein product [Leptidea sinapis]
MTNSVDIFLSRPRYILRYLGIWPKENHMIVHSIYKAFVMMTQYSFILFEFIYIADVWGNLDEVSEASYLLFTQASVCYKATDIRKTSTKNKETLRSVSYECFDDVYVVGNNASLGLG